MNSSFDQSGLTPMPGAVTVYPSGMAGEDAFAPSLFQKVWRIVWNNRLLLLGIVAATVVVALVLTLLATPQYTSTARLQISRVQANVADVEGVEPTGEVLNYDEFYRTQYALLESESLAERVARKLNLPTDEEFLTAFDIPDDGEIVTGTPRRAIEQTSIVLLDHVSINPLAGSSLVDVEFSSSSPELSQKIAATWVSEYVAANLERRFAATGDAREFLEGQLAELRKRLEDSERQYAAYGSQSGIVAITPSGENAEQTTLASADLAAINQALIAATAQRIQAESQLRAGAQQETNQVANALKSERAKLAAERARLLTQFEADYPPIQALDNQIATLDREISSALATGQADLRRKLSEAVQLEASLQREVNARRSEFNAEQNASVQYNILKREVDTNRELYNSLLQRYKEIGVAGVDVSNAQLVDAPRVPREPSSPNLPLNLALGILLGVGLAGATLFIREEMDRSLRDPSDVKEKLGVSLLGVIPRLEEGDVLEELRDPKSAISEAYLSLSVMLDMSTPSGFPNTVICSSSVPSEGKTSTSYAIASRLVRNGKRVILVDLDLRNPSVGKRLGIPNEAGVVQYLTGSDDIQSLVQSDEFYPALHVLTTGGLPPNPGELISSARLSTMIELLGKSYDHVIIDAPPVLGIADAPLLGAQVEGVVFMLEANRAGLRQVSSAIDRLKSTGSRVLGIVVTKLDERNADYGYGSEYGYGYGYGQSHTGQDSHADVR